MQVPLPGVALWEARSLEELADGLRWMKDTLGISDKALDDLAGLTEGYANKLLGPTRYKNLGVTTLPLITGALAVKWVMMVDETQIQRMADRWEGRNEQRVRIENRRPSKELLERSKPHVLKAHLKAANTARNAMLSSEQRSAIARKAAKARWRKKRARKPKPAPPSTDKIRTHCI